MRYARNPAYALALNRASSSPKKHAIESGRTYHKARAAAVVIYGGRCLWCGSTDRLEFDHIDNDGVAHRRVESHRVLYARIARMGAPVQDYRLRLLCHACHRKRTNQAQLLRRFTAAAIAVFARE